jgi:hypothetical protein
MNADESRFCYACGARLSASGHQEPGGTSAERQQAAPDIAAQGVYHHQAAVSRGYRHNDFRGVGIPDFMAHGTLITIFSLTCCCALNFMFPVVLVLGIVIMVNASKIRALAMAGSIDAAMDVSNTNRSLFIAALVAFCLGVALFAFSTIMGGLSGLLGGLGAMDGMNFEWSPRKI